MKQKQRSTWVKRVSRNFTLNEHIENMALNKVNIEFLRKQMDKVLEDIEKLKDANREMRYNGNGQ